MHVGCEEKFTADDIRSVGSKELYEKYLQFKLNIDVDMNPKLKWCPKPGCNRYVEKKSIFQKTVSCVCGESICLKCGQKAHPGVKCGKYDRQF